MPLPRASLRSFLSTTKSTLTASLQQSSPITFVVGNESAGKVLPGYLRATRLLTTTDLDSLCSAVVLAYLRTYTNPLGSNTVYIPLSNLPHSDLALRPELLPVLSAASLQPQDLITLSDLPPSSHFASKLPADKTRWLLVDHNALQGELGSVYGTRLFGCIDHHDEEGKVPADCSSEPRIVQKSGSCSSLIVEYCKDAWSALSNNSSDSEMKQWDADLARLALAPILIDTTNLKDKHKVTDVDINAVKYLESLTTSEANGSLDRDEYFNRISAAKNDISHLSLPDILRKDYKQWNEAGFVGFGISSVVKDVKFLIDKAGSKVKFLAAAKDFAHERGLTLFAIMTTSQQAGTFRRELLVWGLNDRGSAIAQRFEEGCKEGLGLEIWGEGTLDFKDDDQWRHCWWQGKVENSRKQVAPMLKRYIQNTT